MVSWPVGNCRLVHFLNLYFCARKKKGLQLTFIMTNICLHINFKCLIKNVENNTILWTEGNIRLVNFPNFYFFASKKKKKTLNLIFKMKNICLCIHIKCLIKIQKENGLFHGL